MTILDQKIKAIKKEIRQTPYHKGTEHYVGHLRARLAALKKQRTQLKKRAKGEGFAIKKSGDATVVLIGPPSVGKSSLLNQLTGTQSRVEEWPFTTLKVIPGMLQYQGAKIQILDLPGIISEAAKGKGRGKEILSVARVADLLLLMVDINSQEKVNSIKVQLKELNIDLPTLVIINKVDLWGKLPKGKKEDQVYLSVQDNIGLNELKEMIWQNLRLIRIYLKPKDGKPDFRDPLILKKGDKVKRVAEMIFPEKKEFKQILLWGPSARFPSQQVSLNHQLEDEDILTFV
jgi:small GTP-binding protein